MGEIKDYYSKNKLLCSLILVFSLTVMCMLLMFNFKGHDYPYHIQRMASIADEIKTKGLGAFPIRVYSANEYGLGYGSPLFYGDIFLYPFAYLILLGLNAVYAYRIMTVILYVFCFFNTYFVVKQVSKNIQTALMAACLYTFSAYFAVDIFIRSAIGEAIAFAFFPLVAYGFYCTVINTDMPKKHRIFLAVGMAGIILSHLISTVVAAVFIAIFLILYNKNWRNDKSILLNFFALSLLTAALSAFFIFPFLEQIITTKFYATGGKKWNSANCGMPWASWIAPHGFWKLHMDKFPNLAKNAWYPGSYGFMIVTLFAIWIFNFKKLKHRVPIALLITGIAIVLIIMGKIIPLKYTHKLFDFMRLPWRTLLFCTAFMSIFGAYAVHKLNSKLINYILMIMLIIPFFIVSVSSYKIIKVEIPNMASKYTLTSDQIGTGYEYLPLKLTKTAERNFNKYLQSSEKRIIPNKNIPVTNYTNDGHGTITFSFNGNKYNSAAFEAPLLYYKGYSAVDTGTGEKYKITESNRGFVNINVNNTKSGNIILQYTGTPVQHISDIISIVSMAALLIYVLKKSPNK